MKKMKLITLAIAGLLFIGAQTTMAQIVTPQPSPAGSVSSTVGLTDIEISYFRPQMKGRKIFGEGADYLLPYGQRWRAGANSGTIITFSSDVQVAGTNVPAGEYILFLAPGAKEWEVILYSDKSIGANVGGIEDDKIVVKASIAATKLTETVKTLTYQITDLGADSQTANIQMSWENTALNIPVAVSFDEQVMAAISKNTVVDPANLMTAARYYLSTGKDLDQALTWANTYLETGENSKQFWNVHVKAQILAKKGDKKGAIKTAKQSLELAKASPNGDFGYVKRNEALIASLK
ncbi:MULTISPECIES: DUF2911 domain-containing protein [Reichenbachiella]|uniref:DUF2911 domain-containing protein n=1 Tax=Reichenbachiella agariperforans TaxID=156994 RepID=A0A1M6K1Q9_REIAG|nr:MULTISPECIES: DUF2911 domain-containing protein [Reichenbachiella]RJE74629.1 hypothetical protein BGP76_15950 [Reichenbachiella sp. MSK19-1]SHJ52893.1 Protein of unknown function [Reichenbachiella agariperforans]